MDLRYPNTLSTFLQIDPLGQYDEYIIRKYTLYYYTLPLLWLKVFIGCGVSLLSEHSIKNENDIHFNRQKAVKYLDNELRKKVHIDDSMEMTSLSSQNMGMVNNTIKNNVSEFKGLTN
jgi:hypothetical protein